MISSILATPCVPLDEQTKLAEEDKEKKLALLKTLTPAETSYAANYQTSPSCAATLEFRLHFVLSPDVTLCAFQQMNGC